VEALTTAVPLFIIAALLALVVPTVRGFPQVRRRALERFARRVDLPLPDGSRDELAGRLTGRNLSAELGACAGLVAAGLAAWVFELPGSLPASGDLGQPLWALVVAGAALAGGALGAGTYGARLATRRREAGGPRIARPTAPMLADYVPPLERHGARATALAPTVLLVVGSLLAWVSGVVPVDAIVSPVAVAAAVVALAALGAGELAGRRLLDQPQVAGTTLELAWSDAIRARILRDVTTAPLAIGTYASFGVLLAATGTIDDPVVANAVAGVLGLTVVGLGVTAVVSAASHPQRHFRRRLWPRDGAPDTVAAGAAGATR
jgi:hypothetical protein